MTLQDVRLAIQNSPESTDWQQMRQARKTKVSKFVSNPVKGMQEIFAKAGKKIDRGSTLSSLDVLQHRVEELMSAGNVDEANALLEEYKKSVSGLKPARKMSREEGSHHDTLIDDWDIA